MANPHAEQAAALLAQADEATVMPGEKSWELREEECRQRKRDIRQEALVEATLAVAYEIEKLPQRSR